MLLRPDLLLRSSRTPGASTPLVAPNPLGGHQSVTPNGEISTCYMPCLLCPSGADCGRVSLSGLGDIFSRIEGQRVSHMESPAHCTALHSASSARLVEDTGQD